MSEGWFSEQDIHNFTIILAKPFKDRNNSDRLQLKEFCSKIVFFQNLLVQYGENFIDKLCTCLTLKTYTAGTTLFECGSKGTTYYCILKGKITISVPMTIVKKNPKEAVTESMLEIESERQVEGSSITFKNFDINLIKDEKDSNLNGREKVFYTEINELHPGQSFGELALLTKTQLRKGTAIAKTDCILACLDKQNYDEILKPYQEIEMQKEIKFFMDIDIFKKYSYNQLQYVCAGVHLLKFKKGQYVQQENQPLKKFFVIKSGEFKRVLKISIPQPNTEGSSIKQTILKLCEINVLQPRDYFGEEDLINDQKSRYGLICSSLEGSLYAFSKKEFLNLLLMEKEFLKRIRARAKEKIKLFRDREELLKNQISQSLPFLTQIPSLQEKKSVFSPRVHAGNFELIKNNSLKELPSVHKSFLNKNESNNLPEGSKEQLKVFMNRDLNRLRKYQYFKEIKRTEHEEEYYVDLMESFKKKPLPLKRESESNKISNDLEELLTKLRSRKPVLQPIANKKYNTQSMIKSNSLNFIVVNELSFTKEKTKNSENKIGSGGNQDNLFQYFFI